MQSVSLHPTHNLKTAHTSKIGSIFKDRRALMSLGEEEVASQTFINIKYIRAIESGDYSAFPARVAHSLQTEIKKLSYSPITHDCSGIKCALVLRFWQEPTF